MSEARWAEVIEGGASVIVEGVPLHVDYKYNLINGDVEGCSIFLAADEKCETDIFDLVWRHYEEKLLAAIQLDAKGAI